VAEEVYVPWYRRVGFGFTVGGGVDDFARTAMRDLTDIGGSWNARLTIGTHSYIAGEVSYIGSAQSVDFFGLGTNATLVGNGVQGNLRVNMTTHSMFQPYIFGGGAWRHYSLSNNDFNAFDINTSDDVAEVPVGAGIAFNYAGFVIDARGEYRWAFGGDMVPSLTNDDRAMDRWGVSGNVGFEF